MAVTYVRRAEVSAPVWALGSFLQARICLEAVITEWFQRPCGLWGLFYKLR